MNTGLSGLLPLLIVFGALGVKRVEFRLRRRPRSAEDRGAAGKPGTKWGLRGSQGSEPAAVGAGAVLAYVHRACQSCDQHSFLSSVEEIAVSATNVATSPRTAASYGVHSEVGVLRKVLVYRGLGGRQRHEALLATDPVLAAPDAQVGLLKQLALQEATTVGLIHCSVAAGRQTASSR